MQAVQKWRNIMILKNTFLIQSSRIPNPKFPSFSGLASFHSTNSLEAKLKYSYDEVQRSSKGNKRTTVTQKRAEDNIRFTAKPKRPNKQSALNNIVFHLGCQTTRASLEPDRSDPVKSKQSRARQAIRAQYKKAKRKARRGDLSDDTDAAGKQDFAWRNHFRWSNFSFDEEKNQSSTKSDIGSSRIGTHAGREILGLPLTGPLKIEDVKAAFRLSALKWHPDKHQGSSQAEEAEKKFKECLDAYNSLSFELSA